MLVSGRVIVEVLILNVFLFGQVFLCAMWVAGWVLEVQDADVLREVDQSIGSAHMKKESTSAK